MIEKRIPTSIKPMLESLERTKALSEDKMIQIRISETEPIMSEINFEVIKEVFKETIKQTK